jgi:hypothetical protein
VPYDLPAEYEIEAEVTRKDGSGGLRIGLAAEGSQFVVMAGDREKLCGLGVLDGKVAAENSTPRNRTY